VWLATDTIEKILNFYLKIKPSTLFTVEEQSGKSTITKTAPGIEEPQMRELWSKWTDAVTTAIYDRGLASAQLVMDDLVKVMTSKRQDAKQIGTHPTGEKNIG